MSKTLTAALLLSGVAAAAGRDVFAFEVTDSSGQELSLSTYRGKVLLIVNVASKCGFTKQYAGLQQLYETYGDRGLVVLGFPCNQFGNQEPGSNKEIQAFCSTEFNVTFPVMAKVKVNGKDTHPLYRFLKAEAPGAMGTEAIKWNFTKFLVDRQGSVVRRYSSRTEPAKLADPIEKLLDTSVE